jgi:hypothetical protein
MTTAKKPTKKAAPKVKALVVVPDLPPEPPPVKRGRGRPRIYAGPPAPPKEKAPQKKYNELGSTARNTLKGFKQKKVEGLLEGNERAFMRLGTSTTKVLLGEDSVEEWDDEELQHGRRRDKNNKFAGLDPIIVPKACYDEMVRRALINANNMLRENLSVAVQMLTDIIKDKNVEPRDKLKAVDMVMNRVMGKTPEKIEVSAHKESWQTAIEGSIVSIGSGVIEADSYDEDEET